MSILDMVFPGGQQGSPKAEKLFLQRLALLLTEDVHPILSQTQAFVHRGFVPWKPWVGIGLGACAIACTSSRSMRRMNRPRGFHARPCMNWLHAHRVTSV